MSRKKNTRTIWLVRVWTSYESDDIVAAYESKEEAEAASKKLSELLQKHPKTPESDDEKEWEDYDRKQAQWVNKFPSPELAYCDGFSEIELTLHITPKP